MLGINKPQNAKDAEKRRIEGALPTKNLCVLCVYAVLYLPGMPQRLLL